jgi:HK97 family phage portal protein
MKLFGFEITKPKNQALPKHYDDSGWGQYLSGQGYAVTHSTALKVAVVIRCADVVAKTMASLGCHLYKQSGEDRTRAYDHPLYNVLRMQANDETTAYEFWHMYIFNLMLTDGAYAKVVRNGKGEIKALYNIPSNYVEVMRNPTTKERYLMVSFKENIYSEYDFMYTPGLRFNDDDPEDFVKIARDVLGLTMNLNNYASDYFKNGTNLGGFIEYPAGIDEEVFLRFKEDFGKMYSSVINQHKWALLEGGFKLNKLDNSPEDSQALESRKFQILEVCRMMGVPPHKVFEMEKASYASVEQSNIEYVQETLDPMDERLTQTIYKDLLLPREKGTYWAAFNTNKLLKGDIASRTNYYAMMRQNGAMNANDIRKLEDMNLIPDEIGGNEYFVNGNMLPLKYAKENQPKSMTGGKQ